ncbi:MAG: hypothetical protein NZ455_11055 [Bacteroidia bacterium]|nr:hypothetical protein [Bacteroidia bacterium]
MPLGSAQRSVAPSVSVVRSSPTRSAARDTPKKVKLFFRLNISIYFYLVLCLFSIT